MKRFIVITLTFVLLITSNIMMLKRNRILRKDNDRLKNNNEALLNEREEYTGTIREMNMTIAEFREAFPKLEEELKQIKVKTKYLKDITSTNTETIIEKKVPVHDTVYVEKDGDTSRALIFNYSDHWNTIHGKVLNDSVDVSYHGKDTLDIMAYRMPKRFLFIKHGTKYIELKTTNRNPYIEVTGQRRIAITKRRGRKD